MTTPDTTLIPETPDTETPDPEPEGVTTNDTPDPEPEPTDKPGKEAARYRRQLRETETERDTLRATVEALQRAEAERLSGLPKPSALWASGTTLSDLLTPDGTVDPGKVADAVAAAVAELGLEPAARAPRPDPSQSSIGYQPPQRTWTGAFGPQRHR